MAAGLLAAAPLLGQVTGQTDTPPPGGFQTTDDYPTESLKKGEQGVVAYLLNIDEQGRITRCDITRSSGFARLDEASCRLLLRRGRFNPARDENGKPVASTYSGKVNWQIPGEYRFNYPPPCRATIENPNGCAVN